MKTLRICTVWAVVAAASLALHGCAADVPDGNGNPLPNPEETDAGIVDSTDAGALPADAGEEAPSDAGTVHENDAGIPPPPEGPVPTATEQFGAYSVGNMSSMLFAGDVAFIGIQGAAVDPAWYGRAPAVGTTEVQAGLVTLDTRTGRARLWTSEDGIPKARYDEIAIDGEYTASFLDLTWIDEGTHFAGASWRFLTRGELQDGVWEFSRHVLRSPNSTEDAFITFVKMAGAELYVGSDQGVAVLDPQTFQVVRWLDFGVFTDPWVYAMTAGELGGQQVVAVAVGSQRVGRPTVVSVLRPGAAQSENYFFDGGEEPTALLGMKGAILVGAITSGAEGALYAIAETTSGAELTQLLTPAALGADSFGNVIPNRMAFDAERNKLLIGCRVHPMTMDGEGLVMVDATPAGAITGEVKEIISPSDPSSQMLPVHIDLLAADSAGRYWVAGKSFCNAHKLGSAGFWRIEPAEGETPRVVRPLISGVRSIAVDPVLKETWVGLRDEIPGMSCSPSLPNTMQGLCRLRKDGSCEMYAVTVNSGSAGITTTPPPTAIAFGDPSRKEMALATIREATWVRTNDYTQVHMTQIDPGLNLRMTRAAWGGPGRLWLGSVMDYQKQVDPTLDDEKVNDRSPHGLGYLELDDRGNVTFSRRYVRKKADAADTRSIEGLPSHMVWDVMPLAKERTALVACGFERSVPTYDHMIGPISKWDPDGGGLALIDDTTVELVAPPEGMTFGDVVALVKRPAGGILALDATAGIFTVDVENKATALWAAAVWEAPVRATSMAVDAGGRVAVGTTAGLVVYGADGHATWITKDGVRGWVWTVQFLEDGLLYAGDDQGLVRAAFDTATLPDLGPVGPLAREIWPFPACGGVEGCACSADPDCSGGLSCLCDRFGACSCQKPDPCAGNPGQEGCSCTVDTDCSGALTCACDGGGCACRLPDPCVLNPGSLDCSCRADGDCASGLGCACDRDQVCSCQVVDPCAADPGAEGCACTEGSSTCSAPLVCGCDGASCLCQQPPTVCDGVSGCPCTESLDCPAGFYCNSIAGQCAERQACDARCTCSTPSGCSPGLRCQGGIAGFSCVE